MKQLVKKINKPSLLTVELIGGSILMAAAMLVLPLGIAFIDAALLLNPYVLGVVLIGMFFFGLVGYFIFIRPFLLYRKMPAVQAETDGEFLYIHAKKEAKISLADLSEATVYVELPYLLQKEFLYEFLIHLFSEKYGNILLEIPGHGKYRMYFVSRVQETADGLIRFIDEAMNRVD